LRGNGSISHAKAKVNDLGPRLPFIRFHVNSPASARLRHFTKQNRLVGLRYLVILVNFEIGIIRRKLRKTVFLSWFKVNIKFLILSSFFKSLKDHYIYRLFRHCKSIYEFNILIFQNSLRNEVYNLIR